MFYKSKNVLTFFTNKINVKTYNQLRNFSQSSTALNKFDVKINDTSGIATVYMQSRPVNPMNLEFLTEFSDLLTDLEKNKTKGLILTSTCKNVFCAGLDINELIKPDPARFKTFFYKLQDCWMQLYGSTFPTVAAITGHAPAGGCLLAICCEHRIMVKNFLIGLNEAQLGVVAPVFLAKTMIKTIGERNAEIALTSARLYKTDEALKIGLVDEIVEDGNHSLLKAEEFFKNFYKVNPTARMQTKCLVRGALIDELLASREKSFEDFRDRVVAPDTQETLVAYFQGLKKKT